MAQSRALFQHIWVIESLSDGHLKTGRALVEGSLSLAAIKFPDLEVTYETPLSREQFLKVLDRVHDDCIATGKLPLLHIECHGCPDGLQMANGELVPWHDIRQRFISINIASHLNLIVVLAACYGMHVLNLATAPDRAPFWAAIAPEKEVYAGHVQTAFGAFYAELFEELDGDAAMTALNQQDEQRVYHIFTIRRFFLQAYRQYNLATSHGKGYKNRVEDLVSQAMNDPEIKRSFGITEVRKQVKNRLRRPHEDFERMAHRYFMLDLYPENATRFPVNFDDVTKQ